MTSVTAVYIISKYHIPNISLYLNITVNTIECNKYSPIDCPPIHLNTLNHSRKDTTGFHTISIGKAIIVNCSPIKRTGLFIAKLLIKNCNIAPIKIINSSGQTIISEHFPNTLALSATYIPITNAKKEHAGAG